MQKHNDMCSHISDLCLKTRLSDFTVYVGQSKTDSWKFPVHQLVLSAASNVFNAMFSETFAENQKKEVVIKDISPFTFRKLLLFLYKGVLNTESVPEALELLHASDKYDIEALRTSCFEQIIHHKINLENFWSLWTNYTSFEDQFTSREMKMRIMKFIDDNALDIVRHESKFSQCSPPGLVLIISRDTFNVSEIALCDALDCWSKMQCFAKHLEPSAQNQRTVLGDAFYYIRFLLVQRSILYEHPIYELLTENEKHLLLHKPDQLPSPWNYEVLTKPRKNCWRWKQNSTNELDPINPTTYFVFSKDTFVKSMIINIAEFGDPITKMSITALPEDGADSSNVDCDISFEGSVLNISNVYLKAFVCYKLEVDSDEALAVCIEDAELWGYENDEAVFFSVSVNEVMKEKRFASVDYWIDVFSRKPPSHDPGVMCFDNEVACNPIAKVSATFC